MPKLVILGSSNAISSINHENTHMALVTDERIILVDAPGNPIVRFKEAGLDRDKLTDLIVTHYHPDHVSGIPLLLMALGLTDRDTPLIIHGISQAIDYLMKMLELFHWSKWRKFLVTFKIVPEEKRSLVLETEDFIITSTPVKHFVPNIGLKFESKTSGKTIVYSSDTAPVDSLVELAQGVDILIHEAAGASEGHSSAEQAGRAAERCGAKELYLIHYPTEDYDFMGLVRDANKCFSGDVRIATDFLEFVF